MKNKFIVLTLCFSIIFTNINLTNNKSYANNIDPLVVDGGIISAPMLATVSALAVGTGIIIKNSDDIYDIGRLFYDYVERNNDLTWDFVTTSFAAGHTLINDVVHVNKSFSDIVKGFFDSTFNDNNGQIKFESIPVGSAPIHPNFIIIPLNSSVTFGDVKITFEYKEDEPEHRRGKLSCYVDGVLQGSALTNTLGLSATRIAFYDKGNNSYSLFYDSMNSSGFGSFSNLGSISSSSLGVSAGSFPYTGGYDWGKTKDKNENDSIALPIPGNLGNLVGQGSDNFWDNTDGLVGGGSITLPGVNNPSIDVTDDVFVGSPSTDIPGTSNPSVPNEGIWATIKDFVVSLVVPSDTFWTDTFNGFRDNFSKNFPMLDMSKFDSLAVGGKPFPNLYAYGSKIVDGDVINSIVDWLRPIIAGFIMICLMFFNYRKIYKLIRNTEPFGGIAQGSSDFRTGLSAPPINNGLDPNPMGNLRDTLFDMRNEILRRENEK